MNILAIGDIVGESGFRKVKLELQKIKENYKIDFIIANGENIAGGMGITEKFFLGLIDLGIDVVTMGNHTWGKKDIFSFIDAPKLIRPANYSKGVPGKGFGIYTAKNKKIAVINLIGRTDMNILSENPFLLANSLIEKLNNQVDYIIIDFHAEATAEKIAMGYFLDGKANIIFGTHTHVQTSDEKVLPKGTAYITDIGMCGPKKSVIGMDVDVSIKRFVTSLPERYKIADDEAGFEGCIFKINDESSKMESIERIRLN